MNFELLLAWMGHVGGGSWTTFRRAVAYFAEADANGDGGSDAEARRARRVLSDLGYADFFVEGGSSWRAFAPMLGRLRGGEAVLCGVRNPGLVNAVREAAESVGCETTVENVLHSPRRVAVRGEERSLRAVSDATDLRFISDLPARLAAALVPIPSTIETADAGDPPINWSHSTFDLHRLSWSERAAAPTAHEYRSRYGALRHFADVPGRGLVVLDRRTAVYAAAFVNSVELIEYNGSTASLSAPLAAPLPAAYARAATLCSGRPSTVVDGRSNYSGIPPDVAAVLRVASGGAYPGSPMWFRRRFASSR